MIDKISRLTISCFIVLIACVPGIVINQDAKTQLGRDIGALLIIPSAMAGAYLAGLADVKLNP